MIIAIFTTNEMLPELAQLTCFIAVAEELHFGRAAERLCMTQAPLSRQIQALEHSIGAKLFERTSRTVRLTSAGRVFLIDARRVLNMSKQAATTAVLTSRGVVGRVTVGFTSVMGFELMPMLTKAARKALPDIDLVLKEMVAVAQLEALENNAIDIGFLWPLQCRLRLEYQAAFQDPLMVALRVDHPLAKRSHIGLDSLEGLPFIMYSPGQGKYLYNRDNGLFVSSGVIPNYIQHLDHVLTILCMVRSGMGVSIVPASSSFLRLEDVVFRPLKGNDIVMAGRMAWRPDHHNPALANFRDFASEFLTNAWARRKSPIARTALGAA